MCLSPEVDLAAASVITVFAVDAIRHNKDWRSLPIALIPGIFAIHTFADAFVWWGTRNQITGCVADSSAWIYLFIAFVLLPIYVPLATWLIEPIGWRKNLIGVLAFGGFFAGVDAAISMNQEMTSVVAKNFFVDYHIYGSSIFSGAFYALATCGVMLLSGQKYLFRWGVLNLVAIIILFSMARSDMPSLWCFWAAITSIFVSWFIRQINREHEQGKPWPWDRAEEKIS